MTSNELRQKYLEFFKQKGHAIIPSSSLVPENDPTVLFTTAGMHPLVPYLYGEKHPSGNKLADAQKCMRTDDIDEVGDNVHHTFFEMLGNWSLGDYFKDEAIEMSWEFLTEKKWLGLDKSKLAFSVFAGDDDAPFDKEAYDKWVELGVPESRIAKLPKKNNWWGPAGQAGPCGPDTEMFYWTGQGNAPENFQETHENPNWVEIWNDVFMQYNKTTEGKFEPLKQKNVDTGMGLERTLAVLNGFDDNYRTDLFWPIIQKIEEISGKKYNSHSERSEESGEAQNIQKEFRIIADHIKAAVFAINDGVLPSNKGAGYIVRRLIRRAMVAAHKLGLYDEAKKTINKREKCNNILELIAEPIFSIYKETQYNLAQGITTEIEHEEIKFIQTLEQGLKELRRLIRLGNEKMETDLFEDAPEKPSEFFINAIKPKDAFDLYQTYGFPLELINEELSKYGLFIDPEEFQKEYKHHQDLSRTASSGMFKGGLADASMQVTAYHTATHLLLASLRKILGEHVLQKGSNITAERLRFDFSHPSKMTPEQIEQVEELVNEQIQKDLPVTLEEMTVDEAKKSGAMGVFESKYGEKVKVYTIGTSKDDYFSIEICGGPHVEHTGVLGHFKITKEEASSAGIRRLKAILELK